MNAFLHRTWQSLPPTLRHRATLSALAFAAAALLLLSFHQVVRGAVQAAHEREVARAQQPAPEPSPEAIAEAEVLVTVPQRVSLADTVQPRRAAATMVRWVP